MPDTGNAKDCHPQIFRFLHFKKNVTCSFTVRYCFSISFCLCRACFTRLISSNLSCNLCSWFYDELVHFNKEINANVYGHSLWQVF